MSPRSARVGRGVGRPAFALPLGGGVLPWFVEDFSGYGSGVNLFGTPPSTSVGTHTGPFGTGWTGFYREDGGSYTLDTVGVNIDGFNLARSLRVNFPDTSGWSDDSRVVNAQADRLDNFTMRPVLVPNGAAFNIARHLWIETYLKFSANWSTKPDPAWGATGPPDHKTLLINAEGPGGGLGRWEVKIGSGTFGDGTTAFKCGDPVDGEGGLPNLLVASPPDPLMVADNLWNDEWFRLRLEIDIGTAGVANGTYRVWLKNTLVHQRTGILYNSAITGLNGMQMGANRNHGQTAAMHFSWGLIRVYNTNPGWI